MRLTCVWHLIVKRTMPLYNAMLMFRSNETAGDAGAAAGRWGGGAVGLHRAAGPSWR